MGFIKSEYSDGFFNVNYKNGFLPESVPLEFLPERYQPLQDILDNMPVKINSKSGYLDFPGKIFDVVSHLPNLIDQVQQEDDIKIIQALFRGYSFLASAYTLEPSFQHYRKTGKYGKANNILPEQIAQPFVEVSNMLEVYPWLDYHYAYSLGNFKKIDKKGDHTWSNLDMCVRFSGQPDEVGFIMLHVDINQHSPDLVGSVISTLHSIKNNEVSNSIKYLKKNYLTMRVMNREEEKCGRLQDGIIIMTLECLLWVLKAMKNYLVKECFTREFGKNINSLEVKQVPKMILFLWKIYLVE